MRSLVSAILIVAVGFTIVDSAAEARVRRRPKRPAIINEKKLYERMGGAKIVGVLVDEWMRLNLLDQKIAPWFARAKAEPQRMARLRKNLVDQLCEISDGPCQYHGGDMQKVHGGLAISDEQFLIVSDNLFKSMQKYNVPEREKDELLSRLGELRTEIVRDSTAPPPSS